MYQGGCTREGVPGRCTREAYTPGRHIHQGGIYSIFFFFLEEEEVACAEASCLLRRRRETLRGGFPLPEEEKRLCAEASRLPEEKERLCAEASPRAAYA